MADGILADLRLAAESGPENTSLEMDANISMPENYHSPLHPALDILIGIYMTVCMLFSTMLNLLVLVTMARRSRKLASLEYYVIFLSVMDISQAVAGFPLVILSSFYHGWFWGEKLCQYEAAVVFFSGCASISTLAMMSVMRYIKTCHAQFGLLITTPVVFMSAVVVCVLSGVWSLGPVLGWGRYELEPYHLSCSLAWEELEPGYTWAIFIFCFGLPVLIMMYCYGRMVATVHQAQKNVMVKNKSRMDIYLTKMSACMCLCFLVAWTPYAVISLMYVTNAGHLVPLSLIVGAPLFAKTSTWYNPIVYFLAVKRFRQDAKEYVIDPLFCGGHRAMVEAENTLMESVVGESKTARTPERSMTPLVTSHMSVSHVSSMEENHNTKEAMISGPAGEDAMELTYICSKKGDNTCSVEA